VPFPVAIVGRSTMPFTHEVDAAWLRAFSDVVDNRSAHHLAHPLFPVCLEWPAVMAAARLDDGALLDDERRRGVHATHDLTIHRLLRPGEVVTTTATIEAIEPRSRGTFERLRLETRDDEGSPVATTIMGSMFLGVRIATTATEPNATEPTTTETTAARDHSSDAFLERRSDPVTFTIAVAADQARTYSEASRIWNPIHTDAAAAARAGLPSPILHGTCTLALATSAAMEWVGAGATDHEPGALRRVRAHFAGMVTMPSRLELRVWRRVPHEVHFEVVDDLHTVVLRDGRLDFSP
jgi:acyl dehydratase